MRNTLIVKLLYILSFVSLFVTGCKPPRVEAREAMQRSTVCLDGVQYYEFVTNATFPVSHGYAPRFKADGTLAKCRE